MTGCANPCCNNNLNLWSKTEFCSDCEKMVKKYTDKLATAIEAYRVTADDFRAYCAENGEPDPYEPERK